MEYIGLIDYISVGDWTGSTVKLEYNAYNGYFWNKYLSIDALNAQGEVLQTFENRPMNDGTVAKGEVLGAFQIPGSISGENVTKLKIRVRWSNNWRSEQCKYDGKCKNPVFIIKLIFLDYTYMGVWRSYNLLFILIF